MDVRTHAQKELKNKLQKIKML